MDTMIPKALAALLSPPRTTREQALRRMESISACTHLMASVEHLARPQFRRAGGLNNWEISRHSSAFTSKPVRAILDLVGRPEVTTGIYTAKAAAALWVMSPWGGRRTRFAANAALAATSVVMHPRQHYGTDGSDQVSFLVQAAAALGRSSARPAVVDASLWAVALQSTMSYTVSGFVKLAGDTWRQGKALEGVTRTMTYGDRWTYDLLRRFPRAGRVVGASVLALECSAPLAYLGRGRLARLHTLGTTGMHLGIAKTMALGRFVPAFTSMHPAVLYTARDVATTAAPGTPGRDDRLMRMAVAAGLAVTALAIRARRANRTATLAGRGDEQQLVTRDGNTLAYRRTGRVGAPGPVYVLESALMAMPEHWEWIAERLGADAEVVTYCRAGYGPSTALPGTAILLTDLVDHAVDVVREVAAGRPVVLVGHSLGGHLAMCTAERLGDEVRAVVLVDSSHPEELRRSERQSLGAESLTKTFPLMCASLELGLGFLLDTPDWAVNLPAAARRTVLAQYRDSRLWKASRREWSATVRAFRGDAAVPRLDVPVLGLSAQLTVRQEALQGRMHEEMVEAGADGGRYQVIPFSDHDTLLTNRDIAGAVATAVTAFVDQLPPPTRVGVRAGGIRQEEVA